MVKAKLPPTPEEIIAMLLESGYQVDHLLSLTNLELLSLWEDVEIIVNSQELTVLEQIINSLNALGYDTDSQYERIQSIINVFVGTSSWNVDVAEALMLAMEDGIITDAEIDVIFSLDTVKDTAKDQADEAEDEAEEATDIAENTAQEARLQYGAIGVGINLAPLYNIFGQLSLDIGERLERWIANATGIEQE